MGRPPRPTEHPLDEDFPGNWRPLQIRYAKLDFTVSDRGNLIFSIANHETWDGDDLNDGLSYASNDRGSDPTFIGTPYDLKVSKACYLILRLSDRNWRFRETGHGAITTKYEIPGRYARLVHVDNRIVYFACKEKAPPGRGDSLNFHVIFTQDGGRKRLPMVIDPDIKYPEGTGKE